MVQERFLCPALAALSQALSRATRRLNQPVMRRTGINHCFVLPFFLAGTGAGLAAGKPHFPPMALRIDTSRTT